MRNMKKTIPALLLVLGLALSITACGNKGVGNCYTGSCGDAVNTGSLGNRRDNK